MTKTRPRITSADPTDPARVSALCERLRARKGDPGAWMAAETIEVLAGITSRQALPVDWRAAMKEESDGSSELRILRSMTPDGIQNFVDIGLRHKSGLKPSDYLTHFLRFSRLFAYATQDDSWGEFEKEFATMVRRLIEAERALAVPQVWTDAERDGMAAAYASAEKKHGHYECLFAAAAWLLRHRSGDDDDC